MDSNMSFDDLIEAQVSSYCCVVEATSTFQDGTRKTQWHFRELLCYNPKGSGHVCHESPPELGS